MLVWEGKALGTSMLLVGWLAGCLFVRLCGGSFVVLFGLWIAFVFSCLCACLLDCMFSSVDCLFRSFVVEVSFLLCLTDCLFV